MWATNAMTYHLVVVNIAAIKMVISGVVYDIGLPHY